MVKLTFKIMFWLFAIAIMLILIHVLIGGAVLFGTILLINYLPIIFGGRMTLFRSFFS
ncbi:hypothetical protein [Philodulcilactobacillus myokoensis]|nr:hypothetical protein [Philodulcilactobacillus myokoensis]